MASTFNPRAAPSPRMARQRPKALWIQVHLYIGLTLGALFSVLGLTGSLNVYKDELDQLFNPSLFAEETGARSLPYSQLIALATSHAPADSELTGFKVQVSAPSTAIIGFLRANSDIVDEVFLDRASGKYLGTRPAGSSLSEAILIFHAYFNFDPFTTRATGILGIFLLLSVCSGLYIWWPRTFSRTVFKVHFGGNRRRMYFELHRTAGAVASVFLALSCITGISIIFPEPFVAVAGPSEIELDTGPGSSGPVTIDQAVALAHARYPHAIVRWVDRLGEPQAYRVIVREHHGWFINPPDRRIWIDEASGRPIRIRDTAHLPPAAAVLEWALPLHAGEALGPIGRIATLLVGLLPSLLFFTGLRLWMIRRRKAGETAAAATR